MDHNELRLACLYCSFIANASERLEKHVLDKHPEMLGEEDLIPPFENGVKGDCEEVRKKNEANYTDEVDEDKTDDSTATSSMGISKDFRLACLYCDFIANSNKKLEMHVSRKHPEMLDSNGDSSSSPILTPIKKARTVVGSEMKEINDMELRFHKAEEDEESDYMSENENSYKSRYNSDSSFSSSYHSSSEESIHDAVALCDRVQPPPEDEAENSHSVVIQMRLDEDNYEETECNLVGEFETQPTRQPGSFACWICFRRFMGCRSVKEHIFQTHEDKAVCAIAHIDVDKGAEVHHQLMLFCPRICPFYTAGFDTYSKHIANCDKDDCHIAERSSVETQKAFLQSFDYMLVSFIVKSII